MKKLSPLTLAIIAAGALGAPVHHQRVLMVSDLPESDTNKWNKAKTEAELEAIGKARAKRERKAKARKK